MRILYGVQATGNGHITRARTMLPALQAAGITVDFLFSGRDAGKYFDMECFGKYRTRRGFTFHLEQGRIAWPRTLADLKLRQFWHDVNRLNLKHYDLVLTDFEPVSAWAAKKQGVPSVGLAHQYALRYPLPGTSNRFLLRHGITAFAPAQKYLGIHWLQFGCPILPPLIQTDIHTPATDDNFILVYLPFDNLNLICNWLAPYNHYRFRIYAPVSNPSKQNRIEILPLSRPAFQHDLANCSGVISNTGFGLCSEAMTLGKKILTRPLPGQIEQQSNAIILQQMQRATIMHDFDADILALWLDSPAPPRMAFPKTASHIASWLADGAVESVQTLADMIWQKTGTD
ncbi:MJ1255/VC2487 family glycosyltransferase [Neisseria sp. S1]|uniref:MJ1255/VC2487 family glycosyltransferase n=1 Tax=Neisseria sp. S1 TaxID=3318354 RepID=UPI003A84601A